MLRIGKTMAAYPGHRQVVHNWENSGCESHARLSVASYWNLGIDAESLSLLFFGPDESVFFSFSVNILIT